MSLDWRGLPRGIEVNRDIPRMIYHVTINSHILDDCPHPTALINEAVSGYHREIEEKLLDSFSDEDIKTLAQWALNQMDKRGI